MSEDKRAEGVPLGLGMALAQDQKALKHFASLSDAERERMVTMVHSIGSRKEMQDYGSLMRDSETGRKETF